MKNFLHHKRWVTDTNSTHVETPLIPLTKQMYTGKSYEEYFKQKLIRDTTSIRSDLYEFKMSLFDHGEPEEFLLFVHNFNITLSSTGTLETDTKVQYLHTLVRGEALHQFDFLYADVENTDNKLSDYLLMGSAWYFPPVNWLKTIVQNTQLKSEALYNALNLFEWIFGLLSRGKNG